MWSAPACFAVFSVDGAKGEKGDKGDKGDDALVTKVNTFNALFGVNTTDGLTEGVQADNDGHVYMNATYINSGYLSADRLDAGSITASKINTSGLHSEYIEVKDDDDNIIFKADKENNIVQLAAANITGELTANSITVVDPSCTGRNLFRATTTDKSVQIGNFNVG